MISKKMKHADRNMRKTAANMKTKTNAQGVRVFYFFGRLKNV